MVRRVKQKLMQLSPWFVLMTFVTACVSTGSSGLFRYNVEKIVEGETTKGEIAKQLGKPEQILILDRKSLENYLNRLAIKNQGEMSLPEDNYEVWIYKKWSHAAGLVFFPSYETAKVCIIVINSKDICVKRLYVVESSLEF